MGTINPSTKPNGSTNWVDTDVVTGPGLSADNNTIFNEINGNLDNANIKAGAAIVGTKLANGTLTDTQVSATAAIEPTKIDGFSDSGAEQNTLANPGSSAASVAAGTLAVELQQLRHVVKRLATGVAAKITNGTGSGLKADGNAAWFDGAVIGDGLARNPAFLDNSTLPVGWTIVNTPTITVVALDVTEGAGKALHILDDGGADCGISQTFTNLRASSLYLAVCRMKPTTTTFKLTTTGATGTFGNLAVVSVSGGSVWQTLSGVIATDATPTNVVMSLVANAANAACDTCYFDLIPLGDDKIDRNVLFHRERVSTTAVQATLETGTEIAVIVPAPGYGIAVRGIATGDYTIGAPVAAAVQAIDFSIQEDVNGSGFVTVFQAHSSETFAFSATTMTRTMYRVYPLQFTQDSPTVGAVYKYRLSVVAGNTASILAVAHRLSVDLVRL